MKRSPQVRVNYGRPPTHSTFPFAGWLPVWSVSVTLWKPGLNIARKITFSSRGDNGRMLKSLGYADLFRIQDDGAAMSIGHGLPFLPRGLLRVKGEDGILAFHITNKWIDLALPKKLRKGG